MSQHHLSTSQARSLLNRASEHTHRPVLDIADTVLRTGALPPQTRGSATGGADQPRKVRNRLFLCPSPDSSHGNDAVLPHAFTPPVVVEPPSIAPGGLGQAP
jgi:hypothetical protein